MLNILMNGVKFCVDKNNMLSNNLKNNIDKYLALRQKETKFLDINIHSKLNFNSFWTCRDKFSYVKSKNVSLDLFRHQFGCSLFLKYDNPSTILNHSIPSAVRLVDECKAGFDSK
ncbi:hypothetical protein BpHYR1_011631 [Brachionus plicatilis]|uniref:Uncharacterized protein n=1 Tax=Brachionus plicatilis TaxID=10195 RepID=A0A3M7SRN5_BRAPC|nr:hypothetical protein BpHYR1_011631 [Brachionus plicatilis]